MRKLDVKEIHGYNAAQGLKLVRIDALKEPANVPPRPPGERLRSERPAVGKGEGRRARVNERVPS